MAPAYATIFQMQCKTNFALRYKNGTLWQKKYPLFTIAIMTTGLSNCFIYYLNLKERIWVKFSESYASLCLSLCRPQYVDTCSKQNGDIATMHAENFDYYFFPVYNSSPGNLNFFLCVHVGECKSVDKTTSSHICHILYRRKQNNNKKATILVCLIPDAMSWILTKLRRRPYFPFSLSCF